MPARTASQTPIAGPRPERLAAPVHGAAASADARTRDPVHFAPLESKDAKRIARLQRKLFPRELREPAAEIRRILRNTEQHLVCNFSFGLFDGNRLAGYVFAYIEDESLFHRRKEDVVYIKEIGLTPGYERYLRPLFQQLFEQWLAFTPDIAVEAHAVPESLVQWRRLVRAFRYFGLELSARDAEPEAGQPAYKLLRLDIADSACRLREQPLPLPAERWRHRGDTTVSVVQDPRQWLSLEHRWNELLAETADANVLQSFDYLWEWWKCFGIWNDLRVFVIRSGDEVIGIAPFMITYFPVFGRVVRKLQFLTTPMEMNRPKFLFGRNGDRCLPALLAWLSAHRDEWDILDVDEQLDGETADAVRAHFRQAGCLTAESQTLCPYIDVEGGWETFLASRSRRMRGNVKRLRRRVAERGEVTVRRLAGGPDAEAAIDLYCAIEERSWKAVKALDLGSDRSRYYFYKGLAERFGPDGFEMRVLHCGGKAIAATFGLLRDGVFQSLKIAHDSAYDRLSPGTVLESYELEQLFETGISRYEFMGSFLANKLRWTSTVIETTNIHVYQRQPRLVLFWSVFFVFKRRAKALLKMTGQFERLDRFLSRFRNNPFPRY